MADKLTLEVITPEKLTLRETVDEVILPGLNGELGILPGHTAMISQLKTGVLSYRTGSDKKLMHVSGGFAEALPDRVSVMADVAEKADEIDLKRAQESRSRAEQFLNSSRENDDLQITQVKLERALIRIQLAQGGI